MPTAACSRVLSRVDYPIQLVALKKGGIQQKLIQWLQHICMVTKMAPALVSHFVIAPINLDLNSLNCVQTLRHQTTIIRRLIFPCQKSNGNAHISNGENVARTIRVYMRHSQERLKCVLN